ncbi:hypothetical protein GOP47_0010522 [Adiantum capillus-veneris]|uniref:Protein kinase domain-containing protein n=1 Tax=Adiantum capillus-veneris TaxID=13818 RepID=A0A9D4ZIU3_ADICA|nr:hypothetical protein GOP47_0010522 [Adiantum capillus-veneris]
MVCYEILTGKVPFDDGGKLKDLHKRLLRGERPILPSSCPPYLASYVERCWHTNPEKRPSFAQISRTLRHLKGILLKSASPSCSLMEDKFEQTLAGSDWVFAAKNGFTTKSMTITIEMSWYNELESKLRERIEAAAKIKQFRFTDLVSKVLGRFRGSSDKGLKQEEYVMIPDSVKCCPLRIFPYEELHQATDGFSTNNRIECGRVFKGTLVDGQVVAVKDFTDLSMSEFLTELEVSGSGRHPNLVPNLGFCYEEGNFLLVHKFMPGGALSNYLRPDGVTQLTWAQKYKIVCGLTSALSFLHNDCSPPVVHRDVKPSNIFLDDNQEACLTDFGIARPLFGGEADVTAIMGSFGYVAPEYVTSGTLALEADVYSFGVVVLELLCGRRVIDRNEEIPYIVEYAWRLHQQERLLDATRENIGREGHHYDEEELRCLLHLGLACTSHPEDRPAMRRVVQVMSKEVEAPIPPHFWRIWDKVQEEETASTSEE